jgi:hypothetical protein
VSDGRDHATSKVDSTYRVLRCVGVGHAGQNSDIELGGSRAR